MSILVWIFIGTITFIVILIIIKKMRKEDDFNRIAKKREAACKGWPQG